MDDFLRGYVTCALWSSSDNATDSGGEPLDKNYDVDDIAPETLDTMRAECTAFVEANRAELEEYARRLDHVRHRGEGSAWDWAGHDFWLTRNGHGAGFWDRGLGELGERLTKACRTHKPVDLYVGDDGAIYS